VADIHILKRPHPYERGGPKYIVKWSTSFDNDRMTPTQAAIEALRELKTENPLHVRWDAKLGKHVPEPIKQWDAVLQEFVPIEEPPE